MRYDPNLDSQESMRRNAEHVLSGKGLPLFVGGAIPGDFGDFAWDVWWAITQAKAIKTRLDQKYMSDRRKDAERIVKTTRKLAGLIVDYKKAWGLSDSLDELLEDFDEHIPDVINERRFLGVTASIFGLLIRHFQNEAKEATREAKGYPVFIRTVLVPLYRRAFGQEPSYTCNDVKNTYTYTGPFVTFARAVLDLAGVTIKDGTIVGALKGQKEHDG